MTTYDDIINLPHHQSKKRAHMSISSRAAQFAPFAALTGYGAAVNEAARLTDSRIELTETKKEELNSIIQQLIASASPPNVRALHFVKDNRKDGGAYCKTEGKFRKLDLFRRCLVLSDNQAIPIDNIFELEILPDIANDC